MKLRLTIMILLIDALIYGAAGWCILHVLCNWLIKQP